MKFNKGPVNGISVLIAYAQNPHLKTRAGISSGKRGLNFGQSLHLHPLLVHVSSEGSSEFV